MPFSSKVGGTNLAAPAPNAHLELGPMPLGGGNGLDEHK
jgi:hypothetical protein